MQRLIPERVDGFLLPTEPERIGFCSGATIDFDPVQIESASRAATLILHHYANIAQITASLGADSAIACLFMLCS